MADVAKRVYLLLGMLFREGVGKRVLVVTHGGTVWMFWMLLEWWTREETEDRFRTGAFVIAVSPSTQVTRRRIASSVAAEEALTMRHGWRAGVSAPSRPQGVGSACRRRGDWFALQDVRAGPRRTARCFASSRSSSVSTALQ